MLVPAGGRSTAEAAEVLRWMREFRRGHRLDGVTIRELIDEGRR